MRSLTAFLTKVTETNERKRLVAILHFSESHWLYSYTKESGILQLSKV